MRFTSLEYVVFLAAVLALYWRLPRRGQNLLLLAASYLFYGWVHPWFCWLIAFSTLLDWSCALGMARFPSRRRTFLVASLVGNLGMLGVFKYLGFLVENVRAALDALGWQVPAPVLAVALPVGISFYTFQTLSYTLDVHAGRIEARRSLLDVAVFVALFPQLVAGPIERARHMLPQIEAPRRLSLARVESGLGLMVWGAFKKLVVADNVVPYVDRIFELEDPAGILLLAGALGFAVQILADFSAYTDLARGSARLLGFELTENFRAPYLASSPSDFWRRWHISFSTWIRDYLYVALGGSRGSRARFVWAATLALALSGLWHGAAWNFVLWGLYHALLVVAYHLVFRDVGRRLAARIGEKATRALAVPSMFTLTLLGWLLFRQGDLGRLARCLARNPLAATSGEWSVALGVMALSVGLAAPMMLYPLVSRAARPVRVVAAWCVVLAVFLLGREVGVDFIYFRF